jgi:hypothetical protein
MAITTFGNNPNTTIATNGYAGSATADTPASNTSESWTVTSSTGFPAASSTAIPPTQFHIADSANPLEVITVTNVSGTTWTVTRGAESTTTYTHAAGATFYQVVSAGDLAAMKQATTAATSPVTIANSTTKTVVATYQPTTGELVNGVTFEAIAFGTFATNNTTGRPQMSWYLYWGGSGTVGSTYTPGTIICEILTGTNGPQLNTTTSVAGASFDLNGSLTYLSSTTATANMNLFYTNSSNSLTAAQATITATNATAGGASSSTAVTISGTGPIFLVFNWSADAASATTLTATCPVIYRVA